MDNKLIRNMMDRIKKLETYNQLRGGFDYPILQNYWILDETPTGNDGWIQTTSSSLVTVYYANVPMQNPKMAVKFRYNNTSSGTTSWALVDETRNVTITSGSGAGTSVKDIEYHWDTSAYFTPGSLHVYSLKLSASANTAQGQAVYIGGSWTPNSV